MKLNSLLLSLVLAMAVFLPFSSASASTPTQLGEPIVKLMPHFMKMRTELNLDSAQAKTIDAWIAEAPAKRKAVEADTIAVRMKLREAILGHSNRMERDGLKSELAALTTRLIEMRSLCVRMFKKTLNEGQFSLLSAAYKAGL